MYSGKRVEKQAQNRLRRLLNEPERRAREEAFAREHRADTDEALLDYVRARKRELGPEMKPANTVGYCYLVRRLGPWQGFMTRVNRELEGEKPLRQDKSMGNDR